MEVLKKKKKFPVQRKYIKKAKNSSKKAYLHSEPKKWREISDIYFLYDAAPIMSIDFLKILSF